MNDEQIKELVYKVFENHKATVVVDDDEVKVMDWKRDGTRIYGIRYVITKNVLCVIGDLGDAIFDLTWLPKFTDDWKLEMGYFIGKLRASSYEKFDWSIEDALEDFDAYKKQCESEDDELDEDLIKDVNNTLIYNDYDNGIVGYYRYCFNIAENTELHPDDYDLYMSFGKRIPVHHWYWLIGLQMASEQLNASIPKVDEA